MLGFLVLIHVLAPGPAQSRLASGDILRGQVIVNLPTIANPESGYALYLPKGYTPDRPWPLLMGFHYDGRGADIVMKYRAAAEEFGYIVAASNESRNGPWSASAKAAQAMADDLSRRFVVNPARIYLTGLSGGARLAMQIAMANRDVAGVIASSAGFPDATPPPSVRFPVFGTVGSLDFNYSEMRTLDRTLTSPHRVVVFEGGHVLPPDEVARRAVEWMELQAMVSGLRARDEALIERIWTRRLDAIAAVGPTAAAVEMLRGTANEFRKLRDVSALERQAGELGAAPGVKAALRQMQQADAAEADLIASLAGYERGLAYPLTRGESLAALRSLVADLNRRAVASADTPDRRLARRVLEVLTYAPADRVTDREYLGVLLAAAAAQKR